MNRSVRYLGGAVLLVAVLVAGLYAYRRLMQLDGRTPEGFDLLTPVPGAAGFEPARLPSRPVLSGGAGDQVTTEFGYKVAGVPYSYSLALVFPPGRESGRATLTVRHGPRTATSASDVVRRWDEPRGSYAVALFASFDPEPAVPSLCVKAVLGPSLSRLDLRAGSVCVAQRDAGGTCHPESLACGLLRR